MNVEDLDLEAGAARVWGKGGKQRVVGLDEATVKGIEDYIATGVVREGPLWRRRDGRPLTYYGMQTMVRRLRVLGGGVRWTPHTFRNTFALDYMRAHGDPFTLQILGGWTDLEMPRRYTAALNAEDALRVHKKASPVRYMLGFGKKRQAVPKEEA
jgi:integrase/recombinase XerC/integrase/recombinase XerD